MWRRKKRKLEEEGPKEFEPPSPYQWTILGALQPGSRVHHHVYAGTVSAAEKNRRRAKNRIAKKSRRKNRR
jgi:hypothetical protein